MNSDFDEKLLAKIKTANIAPRPRWHFLLKNYVIWGTGALAWLVGAAVISVLVYFWRYEGPLFFALPPAGWGKIILLSLPYFWLLFLGLFIWLLYYNLQHTQRGYRYPVWLIATASVGASMVLGIIFYSFGLGENIDTTLSRRAPFYGQVFNRQIDFWSRPADGRLAGLVVARQARFLSIMDRNHEIWLAHLDGDDDSDKFVVVGEPVRLLGELVADHEFTAHRSLPLGPGRDFFRRFERERRGSGRDDFRPPVLPAPPVRPGTIYIIN